jgi:hypothetical protein
MTTKSDFLPFATGVGADVLAQADYEALAVVATGFQKGILPSSQVNKVLRQAAFVAAAIANLIKQQLGVNVLDDGDLAGMTSKIAAAMGAAGVRTFNGRLGDVVAMAGDYASFYTSPAQAAALAPVQSFNGRTGTVAPANNDYSFASLSGKPTTIAGYGIADLLVNSFNGRSGTVAPALNDYSFAQISGHPTTLAGYGIADAVASALLAAANGVATLDGAGKLVSAQIPASLLGALNYQGTWNAATNTPALVSGTGTKGFFYKVAVAGSTAVDGISQWNVGDSIVFDGTAWDKIDGVANEVLSVAGRTGVIVLTGADLADGSVALGKLAAIAAATIIGSIAGGAPAALTAAQIKSILAIAYADVSGLGSAAQHPASDFDASGAAASAQAASQPLDSDLTAIAALMTTAFGRSFLDRADAAAGRTLLGLGTAATHPDTDFATSNPPVRKVTVTTDTLLAADNGNRITYNNAGAIAVTAPNNATTPGLVEGYSADLLVIGAGTVTVAVQTGDTLISDGNKAAIATGRGATICIVDITANARTWQLVGGLS